MVFWLCTLICSLEAMKTQSKVWGTGDRDDRSKFTDDNESQEALTKIWWNQGEREMGALKNYLLAIFNKQFHSNSIILRKYKCNIHFGIWVVTWRSGEGSTKYGSRGYSGSDNQKTGHAPMTRSSILPSRSLFQFSKSDILRKQNKQSSPSLRLWKVRKLPMLATFEQSWLF